MRAVFLLNHTRYEDKDYVLGFWGGALFISGIKFHATLLGIGVSQYYNHFLNKFAYLIKQQHHETRRKPDI